MIGSFNCFSDNHQNPGGKRSDPTSGGIYSGQWRPVLTPTSLLLFLVGFPNLRKARGDVFGPVCLFVLSRHAVRPVTLTSPGHRSKAMTSPTPVHGRFWWTNVARVTKGKRFLLDRETGKSISGVSDWVSDWSLFLILFFVFVIVFEMMKQ